MNTILDVVEDITQNITDNQFKTIMDSLMEYTKLIIKIKHHVYIMKEIYLFILIYMDSDVMKSRVIYTK